MKRLLFASLFVVLACADGTAPDSATAPPPAAAASQSTPAPTSAPAPPAIPQVEGPSIAPVDEGSTDAAFAAYRAKLLSAVRARDTAAVLALTDPGIRTTFGPGGGASGLRDMLSQGEVWDDFERLLTLGGAFRGEGDQRSFWAPYVFAAWPEAEDAFESLAVVGKDVPLRASSDPGAATLAMLSYDIVRRADGKGVNTKTADGRIGWVDPKMLMSPVGYRAGFMKRNNEWRMTALVAGD